MKRSNWLIAAASLVILIYGMREAQAIVVPTLFAVFVSLIAARPLFWLRRKGVPNALAVLLLVIAMMSILFLIGSLVGTSIAEFTSRVPYYQQRLGEQLDTLLMKLDLENRGITSSELFEQIDPSAALDLAVQLLTGLRGLLNYGFLIIFAIVFMLLEAELLPGKLEALAASSEAVRSFKRFSYRLNRYLALKTAVSLVTGLIVSIWVALTGLDFPLLWGILAFLLNYIPNIGSIIAAVPAVVLALVQLGPGRALVIALGYVAINLLIGNLIEPRVMGRGLGLSTLVIFLSLIFWGWVLGPVGMLLSVPLTMTLVMALESNDATRKYALLLTSRKHP